MLMSTTSGLTILIGFNNVHATVTLPAACKARSYLVHRKNIRRSKESNSYMIFTVVVFGIKEETQTVSEERQ